VHGSRGSIDWLILRRLCAGSLPAAVLTLVLICHFPPDKGLQALLLPAMGIALALTSLAMLFQPGCIAWGKGCAPRRPSDSDARS